MKSIMMKTILSLFILQGNFIPMIFGEKFMLSDYFETNPSFQNDLYEGFGPFVVHDIRLTVDVGKFNWVLLGQERGCDVQVDYSSKYRGLLSLHGASTRFLPLPKKQYNVLIRTDDGQVHNIVLRNTYRDPAFCREKLVHDIVRNSNGHAVRTAHANLYINDEYNGLYQVFEDIDFKFLDYSFGEGEVDMWYYIRRVFEISITADDNEDESHTTTQSRILNSNYDAISSTKYDMYHPLSQVANLTRPAHDLFDFEALTAFFITRKLMAVADNEFHNFGLARNSKDLKFYPMMWDADKSLGIDHEGEEIATLGVITKFKVMNRYIYPSTTEIIEDTNWIEDLYYRNLSLGYLGEGGAVSIESLYEALDILRTALSSSVERDNNKWSKWYCDKRMNYVEATEEIKEVLTISHWNFLQLLNNHPEDMISGQFANSYDCDEQFIGKSNNGMIALLSVVLAINLFSFLFPSSLVNEFSTRKFQDFLIYFIHQLNKKEYYYECLNQILTYEYCLNLFVSSFLLVSYLAYAYFDLIDSSEILGIPYMSQIQFIWIYFIVLMNISFHIPLIWLRILLWACIVGISNIYAIVDLISYAGADTDASASNSRGLVLSFNSTDSPRVFALYIWFRVICQVIFMLYSLQIPSLSKKTTETWDLEYFNSPEYQEYEQRETENDENNKDMIINKIINGNKILQEEEDENEKGIHDTASPILEGCEMVEIQNNSSSNYTSITGNDQNKSLSSYEKEKNQTELTTSGDEENPINGHGENGHDAENGDPSSLSPSSSSPTSNRHEYKNKMKRFMQINMLIFIAVCVGYVIYIAIEGTLQHIAGEIAFSTFISVVILINIRAVYSCIKWFWLYGYGFDSQTIDLFFSSRNDNSWHLDKICSMKLHYRKYSKYLPFNHLNTERKIRTVDGWIKKIAHTYDGLMVFILSTSSFAEGGETSETFSYAYSVSLIYMLFYMTTLNQNNSFGWILYGAKARVMDGFLGRENEIFGYMFDKYMLPISVPLLIWLQNSADHEVLLVMSWYIFMPIIIGDSVAEIVGGTWGNQRIHVWGMGEINRKSWEGTFAMFFSSLLILLIVNIVRGLSWKWYFYAILNCFIATMIELWAYRSTDNVCMLIAGVLLGVAFTSIL